MGVVILSGIDMTSTLEALKDAITHEKINKDCTYFRKLNPCIGQYENTLEIKYIDKEGLILKMEELLTQLKKDNEAVK